MIEQNIEAGEHELASTYISWHGDTAEGSPFDRTLGRYPYLAEDGNESLLVMFTAPNCGVILCSRKVAYGVVGQYRNNWHEDEFYAIATTVTLRQYKPIELLDAA